MLDAGGGGGGTDWSSMSVATMHALVRNPNTDAHHDIIDAWEKTSELVADHMSQVRDYRDSLALAWPPGKSAASAKYLARLDDLISHLNETYEAALANRDALSAATLSISLAQTEMDKIYQEWQANDRVLTQYHAKQQPGATPTPTPSPSGEEPPVAPGQQEALRQRAITLMSGVSSDLAQAQLKIVQPRMYESAVFTDKTAEDNPGTVHRAPVVPPIVPAPLSTRSAPAELGAKGPGSSNGLLTGSGATYPPNSHQPGLVLGGVTPSPPTPGATTGPSTPLIPIGGKPEPVIAPGVFPANPSAFAAGSVTAAPMPGSPEATTGFGMSSGTRTAEGLRAMAPGGMIGNSTGRGLGQPGSGIQRVSPVGGVIGEGNRQTYPPIGGRTPSRRSRSESVHWDPNNPWEIEEGVDPVVLPSVQRRVDPGPAIGLR